MNKKECQKAREKYKPWIECTCQSMGGPHKPTCPRHPDQYRLTNTGLLCSSCKCGGK